MNFKYIIGTIPGKNGVKCEGPIIFPSWMDHKETADRLSITYITSAGFIEKNEDNKIQCYGKSISLGGICAKEQDAILINLFL